MPPRQPGPNELRDHLANERTFLAWIRTAITIVALGFVVAKFGIPQSTRAGAAVGVALVAGGMVVAIMATMRFLGIKSDIEQNVIDFSPALDLALAVIVSVVSIVLVAYLIITA
jgi:putative membrane protein